MLPQCVFPFWLDWLTGLAPCSQANQPIYPKTPRNVVRESNLTHNISWYCWPFFSWVKLLHPLPFKNSRSHKNCDFESETFADTSLVIRVWSEVLRDRIHRLPNLTGAHNPKRSTAINSCNSVFTSEFIFR